MAGFNGLRGGDKGHKDMVGNIKGSHCDNDVILSYSIPFHSIIIY